MKKYFKIGLISLIGLVVIIMLAGIVFGGIATQTVSTTGESQTETKTEAASIGESVVVGDAVFTVNSKETSAQVGPTSLRDSASGKFVVIDITVKNNANQAIMIDSSFFKIKLGEKTYEADSIATESANQGEDGRVANSLFMEEINPDSEINGQVVFDVTAEVADSTELQLQVQSGMFGRKIGMINLD